MKVYFDSIVFNDNPLAAGDQFLLIEAAIKKKIVEVCCPEVVIIENLKHFRERVPGLIEKANRLSSYIPRIALGPLPLDLDAELAAFEKQLRARLKSLGIRTLPLPRVSHRKLLDRDANNYKPFTAGKGYRDSLIWETILADQELGPSRFAFVTGNTNDFCADKRPDAFHADLIADLKVVSPLSVGVVHKSLSEVNNVEIKPKLQSVEAIKLDLQSGSFLGFNLANYLTSKFNSAPFPEPTFLDLSSIAGNDLDDPTLSNVDEIRNITVDDVLEVDADSVYVDVSADADCTIEGFADKFEVFFPRAKNPFSVLEANWNERYAWVELNVEMTLRVSLVIRKETGEIVSFELLEAISHDPS